MYLISLFSPSSIYNTSAPTIHLNLKPQSPRYKSKHHIPIIFRNSNIPSILPTQPQGKKNNPPISNQLRQLRMTIARKQLNRVCRHLQIFEIIKDLICLSFLIP